jgi:hypothetical protein
MAMDIGDAFCKAAEHFYAGNGFPETAKVRGKPSEYNHTMFDNTEKIVRKKLTASKKKTTVGDDNAG